MSLSSELQNWIKSGVHYIGELEIQTSDSNFRFILNHYLDSQLSRSAGFGGLEVHQNPDAAREISTYAEDGSYRFAKAQQNLKRGWVMLLKNEEDLRLALDLFYPASVGLFLAQKNGTL